jgi:hypothetical protein
MTSNTASGLIQAPVMQAPEMQAPEMQAPEMQAPEIPASGRRVPETHTSDMRVPEMRVSEMRTPEIPVPGLAHAPTAAAQMAEKPTVPAHMLPHRTPTQLLTIARQGLAEAAQTRPEGLRYATAHLAALRAAAAVLATRARPAVPTRPAASTRRSRVTSAWSLLVLVAPEFSEWAGYFALGAGKRATAEAGIPRVVTPREADDLLRAAEQFVAVVESALGLIYQPTLAA